jgi:lysophospholipase L1-like esterase
MKKIKSSVAYILGILVFQEIVFRICFPIPEVYNFNRVNYQVLDNDKYHDPDLFLENRTWQSSLDTNAVFVHHFNEYGFRDDSWSIKKESKKKRVLFIGDSFTEGVMVEGKNSIPASYQKLVGENYEVMNAGMNGTGMSSYLKLMVDMIPLFQPDEVKLVLFANDFTAEKIRTFEPLIPQFTSPYSPRLLEISKRILDDKPIVFKWLRTTRPFLFPIPEQSNPFSTRAHELIKEVTPPVKKAMEDATLNYYIINLLAKQSKGLTHPVSFLKELEIIKELCKKNNSKLSVFYLPGRNQVTDKYLKYDKESCLIQCKDQSSMTSEEYQLHAKILKQDCKQLDINFLDLTQKIKELEKTQNLHWNYDEHMRSTGYQAVASEVFLHLKIP